MATDLWALVVDQRRALLGVIESCDEDQLDSPSLCEGWRVRDVAGHVVWVCSTEAPEVVREVLLGGLRIHRVVADQARVVGSLPTDVLIERLTKAVDSRVTTPTVTAASLMSDAMVHTQDVCRPLGIDREIDPDALAVALDQYVKANRYTGGRKRTKGLAIRATDLDWSWGSGPEVAGPGEALLLAAVGRPAALSDLTGPGVEVLTSRM